ncbi:hypothetical protein EVAR_35243_1 [Eumeta japonica]|uniref:Uncharacterized protein n=1 Tax=Eumeta variegata TaxID=151549 RepID=A0A4C1VBY7_EUMVA|nr:hypothetical protein EVAR_35243_1 [Eumeta japonica]
MTRNDNPNRHNNRAGRCDREARLEFPPALGPSDNAADKHGMEPALARLLRDGRAGREGRGLPALTRCSSVRVGARRAVSHVCAVAGAGVVDVALRLRNRRNAVT